MKKSLVLSLLCSSLGFAAMAPANAADWSDTFLGYRYSNRYYDPYTDPALKKHIVSLEHASGYKYGTNFFHVDYLHTSKDPNADHNGTSGEFYARYQHQLEWGKITGKPLAFGPVRDVGLTFGFEYETLNSNVQANKRTWLIGPTVQFDVPGMLQVSLLSYNERNHNGYAQDLEDLGVPGMRGDRRFDSTWQLSAAWMFPFAVKDTPMKFQGFMNHTGSKGKDYFNNNTTGETLLQASLMADIGKLMTGTNNSFWLGIGYEYWKNKYGYRDNDNLPSSKVKTTNALTVQLEYHF